MYFFKKYKNTMMVTLVTIILIITVGVTNQNIDPTVGENIVGNIFAPINKWFYSAGNTISNSFENIGNVFTFPKEKEILEAEILELKDKNRKLENIIGKSDFLKAEAQILEKTDRNLLKAQVISKEPGNWYDNFIIDKGKKDGIKKDTIIIQGIERENGMVYEGLVGRVIQVSDNWSKVSAIVDDQNSVSFKIIRNQDGGIIKGNIDGTIEGFLFDIKADVVVGDELYTSGLGKAYQSDLYIGEVKEVIQLEEELMKKIIVEPAIDFKKIYKIFAIIE